MGGGTAADAMTATGIDCRAERGEGVTGATGFSTLTAAGWPS